MNELADEARAVLDEAIAGASGDLVTRLAVAADLLTGPLRIAIAGRMKSGKSTLLNALVGEHLAPTDATECTRVVTTYREGPRYRAVATTHDGRRIELPIGRGATAADIDLGGLGTAEIRHLDVEWPSSRLRGLALVDTPGLDSATVGAAPIEADAVVYVLRHLHPSDARFLEAFRDPALGERVAVNAIGVLSRADEVGSAQPDALDVAAEAASAIADHPVVRRLCTTVLPVAGLLAIAAATLREDEHRLLHAIAADPSTPGAVVSVDRFGTDGPRRELVRRLGIFGVREAIDLITRGEAPTSAALTDRLAALSGLHALSDHVRDQFVARAGVIRAHRSLRLAERAAAGDEQPAARRLRREIERLRAADHSLAELHALTLLRAGAIDLGDDETLDLLRLLGDHGTDPASRLGPVAHADPVGAAVAAAARWRRRASHPLVDPTTADACRTAIRSAEAIAAGG